MAIDALLLVLGTVTVGLNVAASIVIFNDFSYHPGQRLLQLSNVWLLPLLGAIVVLAMFYFDEQAFDNSPKQVGESSADVESAADSIEAPRS
ncbi:hypothetical protein BH11PSE11_BH11PSE11_26180 [soil metagenome]